MSAQVEKLKNEQTALIVQLHVLNLQKVALEQRLDRVSHTLAGYELAAKDAAAVEPVSAEEPSSEA